MQGISHPYKNPGCPYSQAKKKYEGHDFHISTWLLVTPHKELVQLREITRNSF